MGWFSSSTTSTPSSGADTSSAPDRSARAQCWTSRDAYFGCLDKNGVQVPGQEGGKCSSEDGEYRGKCAASWVDYFNKRRVLQLRQDLMERKAAEQVAQMGGVGAKKSV
ncbi:hypothetical protein JCM10207_001658 [Rhodosporidiobolus poonsookiae]